MPNLSFWSFKSLIEQIGNNCAILVKLNFLFASVCHVDAELHVLHEIFKYHVLGKITFWSLLGLNWIYLALLVNLSMLFAYMPYVGVELHDFCLGLALSCFGGITI